MDKRGDMPMWIIWIVLFLILLLIGIFVIGSLELKMPAMP